MAREEWALQRTGEENEPAVADADRAESSEAIFGQTCPIETAVDVPAWRNKAYDYASSARDRSKLHRRAPKHLDRELKSKATFADKNLHTGLRLILPGAPNAR